MLGAAHTKKEVAQKLGVTVATVSRTMNIYGLAINRSKKPLTLAGAVKKAQRCGCQSIEDVAEWLEDEYPEIVDLATTREIQAAMGGTS